MASTRQPISSSERRFKSFRTHPSSPSLRMQFLEIARSALRLERMITVQTAQSKSDDGDNRKILYHAKERILPGCKWRWRLWYAYSLRVRYSRGRSKPHPISSGYRGREPAFLHFPSVLVSFFRTFLARNRYDIGNGPLLAKSCILQTFASSLD